MLRLAGRFPLRAAGSRALPALAHLRPVQPVRTMKLRMGKRDIGSALNGF